MFGSKALKYTGILTIFFSFILSAQQDEEKQELYKEYQQITQRLQTVQEQALSDAKLAEQSKEFSNKVDQEMIRRDPAIRPKIESRNNLIDDFERARSTNNQPEMQRLQQEFQSLAKELHVHQQKAMENAELKREGEKLENALRLKMQQIDPKVPELVARLETISNQLQGL
jgi:Tfp pilus assembly pilus retraction ATPase PilT